MVGSRHRRDAERSPTWTWLALGLALLVLLLAFALRVYRLNAQSVWFDEGWSWHLARLPLDQMALVTAGDRSPLLYYALLRGWIAVAGESEFSMRLLSVIADVLTVSIIIALSSALGRQVQTLQPRRLPVLPALLYSVCPFAVWYAQETRMYALVAAFCLASSYWLWRWLSAPHRQRYLVFSVILMGLAVYSHYYAIFLLPAQGLAVLLLRTRAGPRAYRDVLRWFVAAGCVVVALLPWLLYASIGFAYDDGFVFPLNTVSGRVADWIRSFTGGGVARGIPDWSGAALALAVVCGGLAYSAGRQWRSMAFTLALTAGPLLAATVAVRLVYPYRSVFHPRYLIYVAPMACLLIAGSRAQAGSVFRLKGRDYGTLLARGLSLLVLAILAVLWLPGLYGYYADPKLARDDVRDATRHVVEALAPGDVVVMTRDNYAVQYYLHSMFPEAQSSFFSVPAGLHGILKSDADLVQALTLRDPSRVRLFLWQDDVVDPQKLVESTLWANGYEIGELNFGQIRLPLYRLQQSPVHSLVFQPVSASFDGKIDLTGYWMRDKGVPGDWFYAVLAWRPRQKLSVNYKVFVHALDSSGRIVFQHDKLPLNDLLPMSSWITGATVRDAYAMIVPADLPTGDYRIVVGVYEPTRQPSRLPVETDDRPAIDDAVLLGTLQVRKR